MAEVPAHDAPQRGRRPRTAVEQIGDRLYALPPEQFVPARDEAVAAARESGDRDAATDIAALRKPTVAAWLVNLLALRRPELLDELFELGEQLRSAQHDLRGEQLRELSTRRREVIGALVGESRRLAREAAGRDDLPVAEVEATLTAALADEEVAGRIRAGRLQRASTYAGFGETPRPRLRVVSDDEPRPRPSPPSSVEQGLAAARDRATAADAELERVTAAAEDAAAKVAEIAAALDDLRHQYAAAQAALSEAQLRRKSAQRAAQAAAKQLATATQRAERHK